MRTALIVVDVQNDFCPGGALAVPDGDAVVPLCNGLMDRADLVVATQDWHPADHASFAPEHPGKRPYDVIELDGLAQVLWPAHCVQGTPGAEFRAGLDLARIARVIRKGTDRRIDSYSGFFDNGRRKSTGLGDWLREERVERVLVCGLATDYCVRATALDALDLGFRTTVVRDACRAVGLKTGDAAAAFESVRARGGVVTESADLVHSHQ